MLLALAVLMFLISMIAVWEHEKDVNCTQQGKHQRLNRSQQE